MIYQVTGGTINMGVLELLKKQARETGLQEGRQEGRQQGRQEGRREGLQEGAAQKSEEVVRNLIVDLGLMDEQAAKIANVTIDFVRKVRAGLNRK